MPDPSALYEVRRDKFLISTDKSRLQLAVIDGFLSTAYWAKNRPPALTHTAIENSLCFGLYDLAAPDYPQIGFTRVLTDYAMFAYVGDVFVLETYRGQGLGKWLIESVVHHPALEPLYRWLLTTSDAHGLYSQFGFEPLPEPHKWMMRLNAEAFKR